MRRVAVLLPAVWLLSFVAAPMVILCVIAISTPQEGVPPFVPPWSAPAGFAPAWDAFAALTADGYYWRAFVISLRIAAIASLGCLALGYPMAYAIARASERVRPVLLLFAMLPFWTGFLLRINAWIGLLRDGGAIETSLRWFGLPAGPLLYTDWAMYLGLIHAYLPFMVLPVYARLTQLDPALSEAAADLGASPLTAFLTVTLPLSVPGVSAGLLLVFVPAVGEYVIPELLGGPGAQTIGRVIWQEFFQNRDWPQASALAVVLVLALVAPAVAFLRAR